MRSSTSLPIPYLIGGGGDFFRLKSQINKAPKIRKNGQRLRIKMKNHCKFFQPFFSPSFALPRKPKTRSPSTKKETFRVLKATRSLRKLSRPCMDSISPRTLASSRSRARISSTFLACLSNSVYRISSSFLVFSRASTSINCSVTSSLRMLVFSLRTA